MSSLHNDLATWAGKARARGQEEIWITPDTADELSEALMQRAELLEVAKSMAALMDDRGGVKFPDRRDIAKARSAVAKAIGGAG